MLPKPAIYASHMAQDRYSTHTGVWEYDIHILMPYTIHIHIDVAFNILITYASHMLMIYVNGI